MQIPVASTTTLQLTVLFPFPPYPVTVTDQCFIIRYPGNILPDLDLSIWYIICFTPCTLEVNSNNGVEQKDVTPYHSTTRKHHISTTTRTMVTKLGRVMIYHEELSHKLTRRFRHVVFLDHVANCSHYISNTTVPMTIRFSEMMTYLEQLPPEVTQSFDYMVLQHHRQNKIITSSLSQCLWLSNLAWL